jgi:hypothetical protein
VVTHKRLVKADRLFTPLPLRVPSASSSNVLPPNTLASTRVRAADSVRNHSAKSIEMEDKEFVWRSLNVPRRLVKSG